MTSGPDKGALGFQDAISGNLLASNQVVPVIAGLTSHGFGPTNSYWVVTARASVHPFGSAKTYGSLAGTTLNKPIVGMAATLNGLGYWLIGWLQTEAYSVGAMPRSFGSRGGQPLNSSPLSAWRRRPTAAATGSWPPTGGSSATATRRSSAPEAVKPLNKPVVGMAPMPDGGGYWLVASDGGIFSYGDASFFGSRGGQPLNKPIVGMAATPDGGGYWLVASDGGIFSYGDAVFQGSTGGITLNQADRRHGRDTGRRWPTG